MTKAILDGRKVQTRRVVKTMPIMSEIGLKKDMLNYLIAKSKYQTGETIWVREPAMVCERNYGHNKDTMLVKFMADDKGQRIIIPSRFNTDVFNYPKWITNCQGIPNGCIKEMARIFLKITNIRVERLQDMLFEDILKEGWDINENQK
jgi:hypothetical protein